MERKLATIRVIDALKPIAKADLIEVAVIGGWEAVVRKGDFKEGDKCLYFEIDSFLPKADVRFAPVMRSGVRNFNGVEGHKLRTVRLRGQLSQGLALPMSLFPEVLAAIGGTPTTEAVVQFNLTEAQAAAYDIVYMSLHFYEANVKAEDFDYAAIVGVVKWDPPLSAELAGQAQGLFPSFIRKTDQERCQNLKSHIFGYDPEMVPLDVSNIPMDAIHAMEAKGELKDVDGVWHRVYPPKASPDDGYEISMKLDGSSMTGFVRSFPDNTVETGVCSRNLQLKVNDENSENTFVKVFIESGLRDALIAVNAKYGVSFAVQGELMGPGIQGNREGLTAYEFFVFDIFDIDKQFYLPPMIRADFMKYLAEASAKIKHVPIIDPCVTLPELGLRTVEDLLKFAIGPSLNNPVREGLVFKRLDGQFSFKAISNLYLEQEKD